MAETTNDYDPSGANVDDVKAYVEANPDSRQAVLDAEKSGKNRSTLVEWLSTPYEDEDGGAGSGDKEPSGTFTSDDKFTPDDSYVPVIATVEDAAGVERIISGPSDGWEPAQVDPDPKDIEAAEERERRAEEAKQKRLDALKPADADGATRTGSDQPTDAAKKAAG